VYPGDTITFVTPEMISSSLMSMSMLGGTRVVVRGIFQSNANREADNVAAFTSHDLVMALRPRAAQRSLAIWLKDVAQTEEVAAALRASLPPQCVVRTWMDANKGLYDVMQLERLGSFLVLALIIVVAAFNIVVALTLSVRQKRRDIAVLRTMGLRAADIQRIWLLQGVLLGTTSVAVGTLLGLGLCWGQQQFSWIAFDMAEGFIVPALPVVIRTGDVVVVAVTALVLSILAAIYPAKRAGALLIVDGVREE
jgi:lipoprotein-releasing system permease protein